MMSDTDNLVKLCIWTSIISEKFLQAEKQVEDLISRLDDWELRDLTPAERERRVRLCEKFQSAIKKAHMDINELVLNEECNLFINCYIWVGGVSCFYKLTDGFKFFFL